MIFLDCEVYKNFFLIILKKNEKYKIIKALGHNSALTAKDAADIKKILFNDKTCGFNSLNYDLPVLLAAVRGASCQEIYQLSKKIIGQNLPHWKTLNDCGDILKNHIDISEVAPGVRVSLKMYGARLGAEKLIELPFDPDWALTQDQAEEIETYCHNDVDLTESLYNAIIERIQLRESISATNKINVLSKSDAQIAESVMRKRLDWNSKPNNNIPDIAIYKSPDYLIFQTDALKLLNKKIEETAFSIDQTGKIILPDWMIESRIKIGEMEYQLGIGGLHSCEKKCIAKADDYKIYDNDVTSYYPGIILNNAKYPHSFSKKTGELFLNAYRSIVDERIAAKRCGDVVKNESLKIVINGLFGKFGSPYSLFYCPELFLFVVLTGQLSLLLLIEMLTDQNIEVLSANTDGVVCKVLPHQERDYANIIYDWQLLTNLNLETTEYSALYSRDVNNYVAIKIDGSAKTKGFFASTGLHKNPNAEIVIDAIINYLKSNGGIKIEQTIGDCNDIRKFLIVRQVNGGAIWKGDYIGKVVRWAYGQGGENIYYKTNGNKVPLSDGAIPVKTLDQKIELDKGRYCEIAKERLKKFLGINDEN